MAMKEGMTMNINRKTLTLVLGVLLAVLALAGCAPSVKVEAVQGSDREAVLAYSEPMVENLLAGMNAADYAVFSRDFDEMMLKAIPEKAFANLLAGTTGKVGAYASRAVDRVDKVGENYRVVYKARFAGDENVQMLVSFGGAEPHKIAGLFFTSDKMK